MTNDQYCSLLKKINYITIFAYSLLFFISCSSSIEPQPKLCNFDDLNKKGNNFFDDIDSCNVGLLRTCTIKKFFQLGDSISDVGNLGREGPVGEAVPFARPPYSANFLMGPTGRASNGNLMIDYFGMYLHNILYIVSVLIKLRCFII